MTGRWLASLVAMATWSGCGCTSMACGAMLSLDIHGVESGQIEYHLTGPVSTVSCQFALPDGESRCFVPLDGGFTIRAGHPEYTHLELVIDGVVVIDEDLDPEPGETYYPNGKHCGGGCTGASQQFDLEAS